MISDKRNAYLLERFRGALYGDAVKIITGSSGSGKTTLAYRLFERFFPDADICLYRFPDFVLNYLPHNYRVVSSVRSLKRGSVLFLDDIVLSFSSRESIRAQNREMAKFLSVARHSGINIFLTVQNLSAVDKVFLSLKGAFLIQKTTIYSDVDIALEREEVRSLLQKGHERLIRAYLDINGLSDVQDIDVSDFRRYYYVHGLDVIFSDGLPSFWNNAVRDGVNVLSCPFDGYHRTLREV